jgi:hypothetical protein
MASLTGSSIASSYTSLLKLNGNTDNIVAGNGSNAIQVVDGDGTTSPLYLNTDRLGIGVQPYSPLHIKSDAEGSIGGLEATDGTFVPQVIIEGSGTTAAKMSPTLALFNSSTGADGDTLGSIMFIGGDDSNQPPSTIAEGSVYAGILAKITDETNSSNDGELHFLATKGNDNTNVAFILDANSRISLSNNDLGGSDNTIFGYQALNSIVSGMTLNTAIGHQALDGANDAQADGNTAVGYGSLTGLISGYSTTAIGYLSGGDLTTGHSGTFIGASAQPSGSGGVNQTVIGKDATGVADNSVTLGNADVTAVYMAQDSGATVHARHMNLIDSADNSSAGFLNLKNDRANPADNDETGRIYMYADDDGGNPTEAILMIGRLTDVSNGNEDSDLRMYTMLNGTQKETLTLSSGVVNLPQGQLKFPATQVASADANTLDDYEEGTWTATDGSGAGLSLTLEENTYVKIGRLVTAHMIVTFPTTSDTNLATLTLPFNAESISSSAGGAVLEQNVNTANMYTACVNGTNACIFRLNGGTAQTNANVSGKKLRFVITYMS